jgi:hypothetical protein
MLSPSFVVSVDIFIFISCLSLNLDLIAIYVHVNITAKNVIKDRRDDTSVLTMLTIFPTFKALFTRTARIT